MRTPFKVGIIGPGGLGLCAIREVMRLPETELVAVLAYSASKNGVDAGELTNIGDTGITVTTDFNQFVSHEMECVRRCGRDFGDWCSAEEIIALLEAGINVITMLPYHQLAPRGAEVEARFNAEPLAGALETLQMFGFGSAKEQAEQNMIPAMMAENYLRLPILFAAEKLGIAIEKIERKPQMMLAESDIQTPTMTIKAGTVGTVSYAWTAYSQGKPFYTTVVYWFLGDSMRPAECVGNDFWTIQIEGRPSLKVTVDSQASYEDDIYIKPDEPTLPGYIMTVVTMVQAIGPVIAAALGLLQPALPQFHWKPDQRA